MTIAINRDRIAAKIDSLFEKWEKGSQDSLIQKMFNRKIWLSEEQIQRLRGTRISDSVIGKLNGIRGIQAALSKTHFVFSRACSADTYAEYVLYKELQKKDQPHYFPFRGQQTLLDLEQELDAPREICAVHWDHFKSVISADAYHLSTIPFESALAIAFPKRVDAFLTTRHAEILKAEMNLWPIAEEERTQFLERFTKIVEPLMQKTECLWALCVPKEKVQEIGYLAHAYGNVCSCFQDKEKEALEKLQANTLLPCPSEQAPPQYRLFPNKLTPENGVFMIPFIDYTRKEREQIQAQVSLLARDLLACMVRA